MVVPDIVLQQPTAAAAQTSDSKASAAQSRGSKWSIVSNSSLKPRQVVANFLKFREDVVNDTRSISQGVGRIKGLSTVHRNKSYKGAVTVGKQKRKVAPRPRRTHEQKQYAEYISRLRAVHLRHTARQLLTPGLGILAADDSIRQLGNRLKTINLSNTDTNRRRYHEVLLGGEAGPTDMNESLSGVLMREESLGLPPYRDKKLLAMIKDRKILLGIRFDKGVEKLNGTPGEYITPGLDKLEESCRRVKEMGAKFALWRCVYKITEVTPSRLALVENSTTLARFAVICQQTGLVPIVAPEVLAEGTHGHDVAQAVLKEILTTLVKTLSEHHVYLEGTLVRVTAASPGQCYKGARDLQRVAADTTRTLHQCLPPAIGGVLLARDETLCNSVDILNHMQNCRVRNPFFVTFCFSLVLQEGLESVWAGQDKNVSKARAGLMKRVKLCSLAAMGQLCAESGAFFIKYESVY